MTIQGAMTAMMTCHGLGPEKEGKCGVWVRESAAAVLLPWVETTELLASALRRKFWYKKQLGQCR